MKDRFILALGFFWCILTAFLIILFLNSCSPVKRLNRLQKRHPYLFEIAMDTVLVKDSFQVVIPGTAIDTAVTLVQLRDTIYISKDNLHVKAYYLRDTLFFFAKSDTIFKDVFREIKVPFTKYVYTPKPRDKLRWNDWIQLLLIAIGLYLIFFKK